MSTTKNTNQLETIRELEIIFKPRIISTERLSWNKLGDLNLLDLSYCEVTDEQLVMIYSLTSLQYLRLDNNQITDITGLEVFTNLKELWLGNNKIDDKTLDIKGCQIHY